MLLIGVAASSSFQHSQDVLLSPGQKASVDGYTIRYVRPVEAVTDQKISFGAVLDVSKGGKHVTTRDHDAQLLSVAGSVGRPDREVLRQRERGQRGRAGGRACAATSGR